MMVAPLASLTTMDSGTACVVPSLTALAVAEENAMLAGTPFNVTGTFVMPPAVTVAVTVELESDEPVPFVDAYVESENVTLPDGTRSCVVHVRVPLDAEHEDDEGVRETMAVGIAGLGAEPFTLVTEIARDCVFGDTYAGRSAMLEVFRGTLIVNDAELCFVA